MCFYIWYVYLYLGLPVTFINMILKFLHEIIIVIQVEEQRFCFVSVVVVEKINTLG